MDAPLKVIADWFETLPESVKDSLSFSIVIYLSNENVGSEHKAALMEVLKTAGLPYYKELGKALSISAIIDYIVQDKTNPEHWEEIQENQLGVIDSDLEPTTKSMLNKSLGMLPEDEKAWLDAGKSWKHIRANPLSHLVLGIWEEERMRKDALE